MVYDQEQDQLRCSAGKYLKPNPYVDKNYKRYVIDTTNCKDCTFSATCSARTKKQSRQRVVMRNRDQDLFEEVQARMRDPTFKRRMSERMWKIEGLFAEAKNNHGLARARYRSRSKIQIQAYLSAIVQNLIEKTG